MHNNNCHCASSYRAGLDMQIGHVVVLLAPGRLPAPWQFAVLLKKLMKRFPMAALHQAMRCCTPMYDGTINSADNFSAKYVLKAVQPAG